MVTLPQWISGSFKCDLGKYFDNEDVDILEHTSSVAIPAGENFTTEIFRTRIIYTTKKRTEKNTLSVIIKCSPSTEILANYAKSMRLFEKEITMYTEILPAVNNLLGSELEVVSAKCISFVKEPDSALILEDLSTFGFKMHPRHQGLDLQHCLVAVEKLAYFHAASAVLHEKNPSIVNQFRQGIYWDNPFTLRWITTGFNALIEASAKWPGYRNCNKKLICIREKVLERTLHAAELRPEDFSVLNHGDFWINNFMFSYASGGQPKDCRFVDFQVPFHSSPAIDLNFFWATSPNIEVRNQHLNTILKHYYGKFASTLTRLGYPTAKIPNQEQFRNEFDNRAFYGLAAAITVLPLVAASHRSDASFEDLFENDGEDGFRHDAYNNERYRRYMEYLLLFYDNLGIFD